MASLLMDSRASEILQLQAEMESDRATLEGHCREIAERMGFFSQFNGEQNNPGEKRTDKQFDSTAPLALDRFAAAMESILTPRSGRWHKITQAARSVKPTHAVKLWNEEVTDLLFRVRYAPRANFASQMHETYTGLGAYGTGGIFVDDIIGVGIRYTALHLSEMYIAQDYSGRIDTVHRKFEMTAANAVKWFKSRPRSGVMPEKIRDAAEKRPNEKFWFLHCVKPNGDYIRGRKDWKGMRLSSVYVSVEGRAVLDEGGYRVMPYAASRYVTSPREVYGRSPAMTVLPDIKMLNEMEKTNIRAAHRRVQPPLLAQADGALTGFKLQPDAINYGGLDAQGNPMVRPLDTRADLGLGLELTDQKRGLINDAFLNTLFQILVENRTMTATEAMFRAQEKGALLAPVGGRQQSELLGVIIERELDILSMAGQLPPMPRELMDAGGLVEIEYTSPLAQAQRAEEGVGILRSMEAMSPLAQIDPRSMRRVNADKTMQRLWEINGAPLDCLYSDDELEAMDEMEGQAAQAAQLLEAAPVAAQAAKTMVEANVLQQKAGIGMTP